MSDRALYVVTLHCGHLRACTTAETRGAIYWCPICGQYVGCIVTRVEPSTTRREGPTVP